MTQLTTPPNETYAVIVPKEAKDFALHYNGTMVPVIIYEVDYLPHHVKLTKGSYSILGTVTSESIDFHVSGIVESSGEGCFCHYKDYMRGDGQYTYAGSAGSFRSLLKSKKVEIGENEKLVIIQKR